MRRGIALAAALLAALAALAGCGEATEERSGPRAAAPAADDPTLGLRARPHAVEPDVGLPSETEVQVRVPRDPEEHLARAPEGARVDAPPTDAEVRAALKQVDGVAGGRARLNPDGTATAPAGAPATVKTMIAAANEIARTPYLWGGGHARLYDRGYDCSGSLSFAFIHAGLLDKPIANGWRLMGESGPGRWVTVFSNSGHVWMEVAGLRFDTSAIRLDGSRWTTQPRSKAGFVQRHLPGL